MALTRFILVPSGPNTVPWEIQAQPSTTLPYPDSADPYHILWWSHFPPYVVADLFSWPNPTAGTINLDLEIAGSILNHDGLDIVFDVWERTVLSRTDNMDTVWWQQKGSATSTSDPANLLRTQALHQRFHRYVSRYDFVRGIDNEISDLTPRYSQLTDAEFLHYFNTHSPQTLPWRMWTMSINIVSSVVSALRWRKLLKDYMLQEPPLLIPI